MKKFFIIVGVLAFINLSWAQKTFEPKEHYNYNIACVALEEGNYDKAFDYLGKELNQYPQNGYAYYCLSIIYAYIHDNYESAKTAVQYAISFLPKKDKTFLSNSYRLFGDLSSAEGDDLTAQNAYTKAIKLSPKDVRNYSARAILFYKNGMYEESINDFLKANKLNPYDEDTYIGLARCTFQKGDVDDAIECINLGLRVNDKYSEFYVLRASFYLLKEDYDKPIDDVIMALKIDGNNQAYDLLQVIAQKKYALVVAKLSIEQNANSDDPQWPYYLGAVHRNAGNYSKALASFYKVNERQPSAEVFGALSMTWEDIGDYTTALKYINDAIALDSSAFYLYERASIYDALGEKEACYQAYDELVLQMPMSSTVYATRAWVKQCYKDLDDALEDYDIAISLEPETYYNVHRGLIYELKGEKELARKEFEKAIKSDTIATENNATEYAYFYLGRVNDAKKKMDSLLKDNKDMYYDAACLYSLMNEQSQALDYLRKALENGSRNFNHINRDRDFDNIRSNSEFVSLIDEYQAKMNEEIERLRKQYNVTVDNDESNYIDKTQEIPFTKRGGVCEVPCSINDLPLYFIFDTGASDVTISMVEASFMIKNKYLSPNDIVGKQNYMTADGQISEGTIVNLRSVKFGDAVLSNVRASVVKSQTAPLLLGQTVLERLGKIEIDNTKKVLKITYKERR